MIVVRVELHSSITGKVTELARAVICNVGGGASRRNYSCQTLRGRCRDDLDKRRVQRSAAVKDYPSNAIHVWNLVAEALTLMRYGRTATDQPMEDQSEMISSRQ